MLLPHPHLCHETHHIPILAISVPEPASSASPEASTSTREPGSSGSEEAMPNVASQDDGTPVARIVKTITEVDDGR